MAKTKFKKMFKKFDMVTALKISGVAIFGLFVLGLVVSLGGFAFRTAFNVSPSYDNGPSYGGNYKMNQEMASAPMSLSMRNIMPDWDDGYIAGDMAEEFEVTEYYAHIKTGHLERTCGEVKDLKVKTYVIFENSNENDRSCNFRFKVEKDREEEILEVVRGLEPEDLNINTESIKRQIDDFTSEEEILTQRLAQVEETLASAQEAYDEVTQLATKSRDVESLAKIINDKIILIEKLTNERLNTKNSLDRLSQRKADQLDKLKYTSFTVAVYESLIIDPEYIKDSWVMELKSFVREFNEMLQRMTVGLLSFATKLIQVAIYLLAALFIGKYGWRFVKFVWKK
ncbi:MAG: hypothetical protein U9P50_02410 [Patescibacteria group bacterium]|nr:hypothetical protein [Patescibacteria group bacterium]